MVKIGKKAYTKCIELMREIKREGFEVEISTPKLTFFIQKFIGADIRTIPKYIENLRTFGFIKPIGNGIFKIEKIYKEIY